MTTVKQLIDYLQTLPENARVRVGVESYTSSCGGGFYMTVVDLDIGNNTEEFLDGDDPQIWLGGTRD